MGGWHPDFIYEDHLVVEVKPHQALNPHPPLMLKYRQIADTDALQSSVLLLGSAPHMSSGCLGHLYVQCEGMRAAWRKARFGLWKSNMKYGICHEHSSEMGHWDCLSGIVDSTREGHEACGGLLFDRAKDLLPLAWKQAGLEVKRHAIPCDSPPLPESRYDICNRCRMNEVSAKEERLYGMCFECRKQRAEYVICERCETNKHLDVYEQCFECNEEDAW